MKIYLLIIKYLTFILDSIFPKKQEVFSHDNIISIYQKFNILPSSYHTRYLLPYRNPYIKKAIWNFKYHKSKKEIKTFSDILSDELIAQVVDNVSTLPLRNPVPLLYPPSTSYILGKKSFDHMNILLENVCNLQNIEFPLKFPNCA
jgi:predicted amidophosphoribosyltransferase